MLQILNALLNNGGWKNHSAVKMWRGYEATLIEYGFAICDEWRHVRRYKDTCAGKLTDIMLVSGYNKSNDLLWLGDEAFHLAHKSNLIRKLPGHYGKLWPDVPADLPYVWPVIEDTRNTVTIAS